MAGRGAERVPSGTYAAEFVRHARPALLDLFERRGGRLESFRVEAVDPGAGADSALCAVAVAVFRDRRFSFRRGSGLRATRPHPVGRLRDRAGGAAADLARPAPGSATESPIVL
ncbi:hypothetical protein NKH77_01830 [Streptomyces sp. M19]